MARTVARVEPPSGVNHVPLGGPRLFAHAQLRNKFLAATKCLTAMIVNLAYRTSSSIPCVVAGNVKAAYHDSPGVTVKIPSPFLGEDGVLSRQLREFVFAE